MSRMIMNNAFRLLGAFFLYSCVFLLVACAGKPVQPVQRGFDLVELGMVKEELIAEVGLPDRRYAEGAHMYFVYLQAESTRQKWANALGGFGAGVDGRGQDFTEKLNKQREGEAFLVRFTEGKVTGFGRRLDL